MTARTVADRLVASISSERCQRDLRPEPMQRAQAEMEAFGFRRRLAHLTRFVKAFPSLLLQDPVLKPFGSS